MNVIRYVVSRGCRAGLVLATGGVVLASSCSTSDVTAILAGVNSVANELSEDDGGVSFTDWLASELDE